MSQILSSSQLIGFSLPQWQQPSLSQKDSENEKPLFMQALELFPPNEIIDFLHPVYTATNFFIFGNTLPKLPKKEELIAKYCHPSSLKSDLDEWLTLGIRILATRSNLNSCTLLLLQNDYLAQKCPAETVYVPGKLYRGENIPPLCVDEHEFTNGDVARVTKQTANAFQMKSINKEGNTVQTIASGKDAAQLWEKYSQTPPDLKKGIAGYLLLPLSKLPTSQSPENFNKPTQPMVNVNAYEAKQLCEVQEKRLPTPKEWSYIASKNEAQEYSTRSGEFGVGIYCGNAIPTRDICEGTHYYIQYNGKEICDLNGNVYEWSQDLSSGDFFIHGGSWKDENRLTLRAIYFVRNPAEEGDNDIGFRCVMPLKE